MDSSIWCLCCKCGWTQIGQSVVVVGSSQSLGIWTPSAGQRLLTSAVDFPVWTVRAELPNDVQFKFVVVDNNTGGQIIWEDLADNRLLPQKPAGGFYSYTCAFGQPNYSIERLDGIALSVPQFTPPPVRSSLTRQLSQQPQELKSCANWMGREMRLARSRSKVWDDSNRLSEWNATAEQLDGSAAQIVEGDKTAGSWRNKLDIVKQLIVDISVLGGDTAHTDIVIKLLVDCAVYLAFIRSGAIGCREDGGHHRPNYHAGVARGIVKAVERVVHEVARRQDKQGDEVRVTARKIHPCLPSFSNEFTTGQPLTRIRDIAHRNDIPQELKQEIKHTIQNKLHRCAGPEDLIATENMLRRFHANPGGYPSAFLSEFTLFHKELQQFFNATDLSERLHSISNASSQSMPMMNEQRVKQLIDQYFECRRRSDESTASVGSLIITLTSTADLRQQMVKCLEQTTPLHENSYDMSLMQQMRLAEIELENVAFVLLSRIHTLCESSPKRWQDPIEAIAQGVRHVMYSGMRREECAALLGELSLHSRALSANSNTRDDLLFMKASIDRVRRLCEVYSELILSLYPLRAQIIGYALGVNKAHVNMEAEADIRANVVFQISRLTSNILRRARVSLGLGYLDPLVCGRVVGRLTAHKDIATATIPPAEEGPHILLIDSSTGDEEVAEIVELRNVVGIMLAHDLPHLSHLGVRARQSNLVFVCCDDKQHIGAIRQLVGEYVSLSADPKGVAVEKSTQADVMAWLLTQNKPLLESGGSLVDLCSSTGWAPDVDTSMEGRVLGTTDITVASCGAKADCCSRLSALAVADAVGVVATGDGLLAKYRDVCEGTENCNSATTCDADNTLRDISAFKAPRSLCVPFGSLAMAIGAAGKLEEFDSLRSSIEAIEDINQQTVEIDGLCLSLEQLIRSACSSTNSCLDYLEAELAAAVSPEKRLMLRSSANVEDLAGLSAAGLYESVPNVDARNSLGLRRALADVWASLYTRRAVVSRRLAVIDEFATDMAVLVQELVSPNLSFVVHTTNPLSRSASEVYVEAAPGLGETLASGAVRGTPYRFTVNKYTGVVEMLSFASYSELMMPVLPRKDSFTQLGGGALTQPVSPNVTNTVKNVVCDYSLDPMATSKPYRTRVALRLAAVGMAIEVAFGLPQDIEGCMHQNDIYIVQSRPQP
eukprot:GHVS01055702.1.p1 GENE.GHVS01055702.1~~GHVS01055702.1.p1  ORF type:complete len:1201 (+),score=196.45 GHVS01055702.1:88-3603(+)